MFTRYAFQIPAKGSRLDLAFPRIKEMFANQIPHDKTRLQQHLYLHVIVLQRSVIKQHVDQEVFLEPFCLSEQSFG